MSREDFLREQRIDLAKFDLEAAKTPDEALEAWSRLKQEIGQRSESRKAEMARERGLA